MTLPAPPRPPVPSGAGDPALFCLLLAVCHAVAETTLLGWYGLALTLYEVAALIAIPIVLAVAAALAIAILGVAATRLRRWLLPGSTVPGTWLFIPITVAYAALASTIMADSGRVGTTGIAVVVLATLVFLARVRRRVIDPVLCLGLLSFCFVVAGTTLLVRDHDAIIAGKRVWLALSLPLFAVLPLGVIRVLRPQPGTGRTRRVVGLAALLVLADFGLWIGVWPAPFRWQVHEAPVVAVEPETGDFNIILIVLDTLRADHMDLFGYERTTMPHLTAFAHRDCAVVEAITATSPSSLPSHGSMFTGMYSSAHGGHKPFLHDPDPPLYGYPVRDDVPTLAGELAARGYRTAGIVANFGVVGGFGLDRGFGYYDARPEAHRMAERVLWLNNLPMSWSRRATLIRGGLPPAVAARVRILDRRVPKYRRAERINREAFAWLEQHGDRPFFLFLNYFDCHDPYLPVGQLDELFVKRPPDLGWTGYPDKEYHDILKGRVRLSAGEIEFLKGQYDAELVYLDRKLHRLFEHLSRHDLYDDTLIIVLSDHGESFGEHGVIRHSTTLYEHQVSVPLLVKMPASLETRPPADVPHMQFVDLMPTILALLGAEVPSTVEGTTWGQGRDHAVAEVFSHDDRGEKMRRELFSVRRGDWKYIHSTRDPEEIYNLALDPHETRSRPGAYPEYEDLARSVFAQRNVFVDFVAGTSETRSRLDKLRALGYIQ